MARAAVPILLLCLTSIASGAPYVVQVTPLYGSLAGGTSVYIYGAGFTSGPMGAMAQAAVFIGAQECVIDPYYLTDSQILCYTPPSNKLSQWATNPSVSDSQPLGTCAITY